MEKKISLLLNNSMDFFILKPLDVGNTDIHSSEIQNDTSRHREGLSSVKRILL